MIIRYQFIKNELKDIVSFRSFTVIVYSASKCEIAGKMILFDCRLSEMDRLAPLFKTAI